MRSRLAAVAIALAVGASGTPAHAALEPATADALVASARANGMNGFCKDPPSLLFGGRELCPLARDVKDCDALVAACDEAEARDAQSKSPKWRWMNVWQWLARMAQYLVWTLVASVLGVLAWFIARAALRAARDRRASDEPETAHARVIPDATAEALETATDAELLLKRAEDLGRRGDLNRAASLYLAASLRALDDRGAIRLARHRTNGEYVRGCKEPDSKPELRIIAGEVERASFGGEHTTPERLAHVAARASAIVARTARFAAAALSIVFFFAGCGVAKEAMRARDPEGDDLLLELLNRQGAHATHLAGSIAHLPMPANGERAPFLIVDATRVTLEEDAQAHLLRWVEAGGRLVLAGRVDAWPESLGAKTAPTSSTEILALDSDEETRTSDDGFPAKVATPAAFSWGDAEPLAQTANHELYAAAKSVKRGLVLGFAGDDLLTNVGLARAPNAAALVAVLRVFTGGRDILVATPEAGVSPPSNPIASLVHAGLGLALVHAAAATVLLMLAFGVRQARARATPLPSRRAWTEHIEATGGLYARAKLAPHALAAYARFVDGRLRERMPRGMTDPATFLAVRANADPAWTAEVWRRAISARPADRPEGDELLTLRRLSALYAAAVKSE